MNKRANLSECTVERDTRGSTQSPPSLVARLRQREHGLGRRRPAARAARTVGDDEHVAIHINEMRRTILAADDEAVDDQLGARSHANTVPSAGRVWTRPGARGTMRRWNRA